MAEQEPIPRQVEPEKPLERDVYDLDGGSSLNACDSYISLGQAMLLQSFTGVVFPFAAPLWYFGRNFHAIFAERKLKRKTLIQDATCGFEAIQLVYRGKKEIRAGDALLANKDNFLLIRLPQVQIPQEQISAEILGEIGSLYDLSLRSAKESMPGTCKAVVIEIPSVNPRTPATTLHEGATVSAKALMEGKEVVVKDPQSQLLILTPQEFKELTRTPHQWLVMILRKLADERLPEFLRLIKSSSGQERETALDLLKRRLLDLLKKELDINFGGAEISFARVGESYAPARRKNQRELYLRKTPKDFLFVQFIGEDQHVEQMPVSRLLRIGDLSLEEILAVNSSDQKAKLAYSLWEIFREVPFEELLGEREITPLEVLEKLEQSGAVLEHAEKRSFIDRGSTFKRRFFNLEKRLRPLLATGTLFMAASMLGPYLGGVLERAADAIPSGADSTGQGGESWRDFKELPSFKPEWRIAANIDASGYYTLFTSHQFADGQWLANTKRERAVTFPQSLDKSLPQIVLSKRFSLGPFEGSKSVKVPIKDGARLGAIAVVNNDGKPVFFSSWQLTDGTVEVVVERKAVNSPSFVDVIVILTPADSSAIHAVERVEAPDLSKLNEAALSKLKTAQKDSKTSRDFFGSVQKVVSGSHRYSLVSINAEGLKKAKSQEEFLNAIAADGLCRCSTCNSEAVLLSAIANTPDHFLNMAQGYLVGFSERNPDSAPDTRFLRAGFRHAYGITRDGSIVDSTPSLVSNDPLTLAYLSRLGQYRLDELGASENNQWQEELSAIAGRAGQLKKTLMVAAILAAVSSFFLLRGGAPILRRAVRAENLEAILQGAVLTLYSKEDLEETYALFLELSYKRDPSYPIRLYRDGPGVKTKKELLQLMGNTVNLERVEAYLRDPIFLVASEIEPVRLKFRLLAQYLMR